MTIGPTNFELADALVQMADLLVRSGEPNPYRVQAYLQAAAMIRDEQEPLARAYAERGREALLDLPGVGVSLASHLAQYIETGRVALRDRLLAADDPAALLSTVPTVSYRLGQRLVDELGIHTLAELERAAHDGRLLDLPGIGPRTVEAIRLQLNSVLHDSARRRARRVRRQSLQLAAAQDRQARSAEAHADAAALAADEAAGAVRDTATEAAPATATIYTLFPPAAA